MRLAHLILTGLSLNIILLSLNRLTNLTLGYLQPYEFLRWLDFNAMLPIPLMAIILYYLLKKEVVYDSPFKKTGKYLLLTILFICGIYFFAAGSGTHEFANYLNARFCDRGNTQSTLCNIISYNDDQFSHYVYYLGFILLNVSLMFYEYYSPRKNKLSRRDLWLIIPNSLFIALGIFANLAFEEIGIDLVIFAAVMTLALYLVLKKKPSRLPVTFYFAIAYTFGVVSTFLYKLIT